MKRFKKTDLRLEKVVISALNENDLENVVGGTGTNSVDACQYFSLKTEPCNTRDQCGKLTFQVGCLTKQDSCVNTNCKCIPASNPIALICLPKPTF